jgi:hypothetical protein
VKTISLKKVSAVAVASLGFGLLSVVPAQATAIVNTDIAATGTAGTNNSIVVAGTAATVIETVTTATPLTYGFKITDPTGTASYIATGLTNATVGTLSAIASKAATLTFATTYLTTTGKWVVQAVADSTAADIDTAAEIDTALGTSGNIETSNFFVTKATPSFSGGAGRTVTSATAISQDVNGVATVNIVADNASASYAVTSSGVGAMTSAFATDAGFTSQTLVANTNDVVVNNNGTTVAGGVSWTPTATTGKSFIQVKASSATAGDQKISVTPLNASGTPGTPVTATITWGATPAVATGTTTSVLNATTGTTATGSDATVLVSKSLATQAANVIVTVRDQAGNALNGQTVSATISGPGLISAITGANAGTGSARATSVALAAGVNVASINVNADGTSGVGTITVTVGTTVVATETVSFFDSPATVTAVQNHKVLSSAGGAAGITPAASAGTGADIANTPAVILNVLDKNGLRVTGLTTTQISAVSSDATVMSETITLAQSDGTGAANTVSGNYNVQVTSVAKASGSTATLKFKVVVSAALGTFIESAPLTYTLGGAPAAVTVAMNKTSYTPGEAAQVTLTLKDSSGNAARDGDHANILTAALSSNLGITGSLAYNATATTVSSLGGVAVAKVNAPATGGTWTVTGTTGTGPSTAAEKGKALTASATVVSETAGLLTQIDALNAKIVALNALIAKIMKKLGVK